MNSDYNILKFFEYLYEEGRINEMPEELYREYIEYSEADYKE